jgi:hypothetical protein
VQLVASRSRALRALSTVQSLNDETQNRNNTETPKEHIMNTTKTLLAFAMIVAGSSAFAAPLEVRKAEPMVISAKRVVAVAAVEVRVAQPMVITARASAAPSTVAMLTRTAKRAA